MPRNEILITENLTKKFGRFTALNKLNIRIKENTCVGYLGPNGSGKSTTIKILTGLLRPTFGSAQIFGFDIRKNSRFALSNVGVVVETPEFNPYLTPKEVLSYLGKLRGISTHELPLRIKDVLQQMKMEDWQQQKIGKFSKGMKQRIALAASLLHDPQLLIVDEPASGLDPRGIIEVREIIKELKKNGKTIFMSSHLLNETQEVCDMVALIDKGNLLKFDTVENISKMTKNLKIKIELVDEASQSQLSSISEFEGVNSIKQESSHLLEVEFEGGIKQKAEFLKYLHELGLKISTFSSNDIDLEALYLDLVSESVR